MLQRWAALLLLLLGIATPTFAAQPDPLLRMPREANLVLVAEQPRKLIESLRNMNAYQTAQQFPQVQDALNSTTLRRFYQLLGYYERELGADWPQLLDKIAGNGLALGTVAGSEPAPVLLVIQGTDEKVTADFVKLALKALQEEIARQDPDQANPDAAKLKTIDYKGIETYRLGDEFHAARVGATIYIANQEIALAKGLDLLSDPKAKASLGAMATPKAARKLLGGEPLAWVWFDMARAKEKQSTKDFFEATRKDFLQTLVFGSTIDAVRRSDFVSAGLYITPTGLQGVVKLPAPRSGLPPEFVLHVPPTNKPGSLPLLEPKGVIYSQSFYLDIGSLWTDRKRLLNDELVKNFEKADKDISKVLPGTTFGKLLEMSGPYHRIVAANISDKLYDKTPELVYPAAAFVTTMRDPQFGKSASAALRAAALLTSTQTGLKMSEEEHDGIKIVNYRFPEDKPFPAGDEGNMRFNLAPCFAVVGDYLVVSSHPKLLKNLIPELRKPIDESKSSSAVWRGRGYSVEVGSYLSKYPDGLITNTVLTRGVSLDEAKKQVQQITNWVQGLGDSVVTIDHTAKAYELKFHWTFTTPSATPKSLEK